MEKHYKLLSGVLAFFLYFLLLALLLNYFNHHKSRKAVHYAEKSGNRIMVSLSDSHQKTRSPLQSKKPKIQSNHRPKPKPKTVKQPRKAPAKEKRKKIRSKRAAKKPKEEKSRKKKVNIKNLFREINEKQPPKKEKKQPKKDNRKKRTGEDRGVRNAYFAKVERILRAWPAQSEYAGETIKVWLRIRQDGSFSFRVLSASGNDKFNHKLIGFLKQLQKIGFGRHQNAKPYELNVEFVAKE